METSKSILELMEKVREDEKLFQDDEEKWEWFKRNFMFILMQ